MTRDQTFVVVGASLTGAKAAEVLRQEGFDGRLVLIGAEEERPYERPPLSKEYLRGEAGRDKLYVHDAGYYADNEIELRAGELVESLDVTASEVRLSGGERLHYDRLLLTMGAKPRRLEVPGDELDGVYYLRAVEDSDALRERFAAGGRVGVVGAGWIGAEVAASARERGLEVALIAPAAVPLERVLGAEVGAIYREIHRDHGVELVLGTGVEALEGERSVTAVRTADGRRVECDFVVVGVGVVPRTALAEQAGIRTDNGIVVDERLQTSVPGVFAAGDVANAYHPFFGMSIRVEHWANAKNQGPAAAMSMLGRGEPYERIPYFFSDQYDVGMEYSGFATSWQEVAFRGDPESREFIAFWLSEGRVLAGMNVNVWDVNDQVQELIRSRARIDPKRLADPDVPLEELAAEPSRALARPPEGFLARGLNYAKRVVGDRLTQADTTPATELRGGEARVIEVDGEKVAVHRDGDGQLHAVSAVCTHMGCIVDWNGAEGTWDCPCHGSRFDRDGHVLRGPARKDLSPKPVVTAPDAPTRR